MQKLLPSALSRLSTQNFLIFLEMDISSLIFLSYFRRGLPSLINEKKTLLKSFLNFEKRNLVAPNLKKSVLYFTRTFQSLKIKNCPFFVCCERTFQIWAQKKRVSYTFSYTGAKFSKLKYFLILITKHLFSLYDIFFYTQQAFAFHILKNVSYVHDHIAGFLFFFFFMSWLYGDFHPRLKFQLGISSWKNAIMWKISTQVKIYLKNRKRNRKFRRLMKRKKKKG